MAPGQNYGSAPYRQLCPAYPSADRVAPDSGAPAALVIGRKAAQERFSEENFPEPYSTSLFYITGNAFLNSSTASLRATMRNLRHTTSLDELAEPNNYSNCDETSSTHLFASHCRRRNDQLESSPISAANCASRVPERSRGLLAESVSSLYTNSFPFHRAARSTVATVRRREGAWEVCVLVRAWG